MMFLYGMHCVALFIGYCMLICLAIAVVALIIQTISRSGKGKK